MLVRLHFLNFTRKYILFSEMEEQQQLIKVERKVDKPEGMDNCFGFGDEEEDDEVEMEEEDEMDSKANVEILEDMSN